MKKILFLLFIPIICYTQNTRWTDYFSYLNIKAIYKVNNTTLFCATENGLFSYNENTGEVKKISKANGLHEVKINSFAYNQANDALIIGYTNGKIDIVTPDGIHLVVDIPFEQNFQGDKKINHIYTEGNTVILSMDFGITIFDLKKLEFKESCYFKKGLDYIKVNKSTVFNNKIYAASTKGLFSHTIDNFVPNFASWTVYGTNSNYDQIAVNDSYLIIGKNGTVTKSTNGISWSSVGSYPNLRDIISINNNILLAQKNSLTYLNKDLISLSTTPYTDVLNTGYYSNDVLYAGTTLKGLLKGSEYISPDGPYSNVSYSISIIDDQLWIAPGGRDVNYNAPAANLLGYYHFDGNKWVNIKNENINKESYIMKVIPNPSNLSENYVVSYGNGLLQMVNNNFSILYNNTNSAFKKLERLTGGNFDKNGNLIIVQTWAIEIAPNVNNAIIIKTPDNQFKFLSLLPKRINLAGGAMDAYIDPKGYIWIPSPRGNGLVVYKYNNTPLNASDDAIYLIESTQNSGNLPSNNVLCSTIDKSGIAWIGTDSGLRIFKNPYPSLESGSYNTERIIIEQNGLGEEMLRNMKITAIAVDGANRKWIGTYSSGVFYLSEDGATVLNKFDIDNSALPSNIITDIKINKAGEVFFVTPIGVVSYRGDVSEIGDEFGDIVAYPNPVRPGFTGDITIRGLAHDAHVKITDVAGNLVFETIAPGGVAIWNGSNFNNKPVASGVYLVLMTNSDGSKKATTKIAIIR